MVVEWSSKKTLLHEVYGYGLDQLHPDFTFEQQQIALDAMLMGGEEAESAAVPVKLALST